MRAFAVPVVGREIPVFWDEDGMLEGIRQIGANEIPAFIKRGDKKKTPMCNHRGVIAFLLEHVKPHAGQSIEVSRIMSEEKVTFKGLGNDAIGTLHNDMQDCGISIHDPRRILLVHTTTRGGGAVHIASPGSHPGMIWNTSKYLPGVSVDAMTPDHPHRLLIDGLTDPRLMDTEVFEGEVGRTDTLIQIEGGPTSPWHRFDTDPAYNAPGNRDNPIRLVAVSQLIGVNLVGSMQAIIDNRGANL